VSNNESFIDEVTEEVRKDRLYGYARRYGWIAVVLVLGIVGGTAWREWTNAEARATAEAFGDGILDALDLGAPADRAAALAAIPASGEQAAVLGLMRASDPASDRAAALAALDEVAAIPGLRPKYRDLAILRRAILGRETPVADRRAALDGIAAPGAPYRTLAQEQLALLLAEEGRTAEAIDAFLALRQDQEATQGLRARADQMIVALGGEVPAGEPPLAPAGG
jgi:hypothetical protein